MGNKIFINLVESFNGDGVPAAGDDLLVLDFGDLTGPVDWHFTQQCVGNNSNSLCGDPDTLGDGAGNGVVANASVGGAGSGHVFYEFSRPLESRNGFAPSPPKEDLFVPTVGPTDVGLRLRVTHGKGGGKGGFVFPDPQTAPTVYHRFTIQ